jgi:hypothetical protein
LMSLRRDLRFQASLVNAIHELSAAL